MDKVKIGVLCPSEIALRRFLPALQQSKAFEYAGVAVAAGGEWFGEPALEQVAAEQAKAQKFVDSYGGKIFAGYGELLRLVRYIFPCRRPCIMSGLKRLCWLESTFCWRNHFAPICRIRRSCCGWRRRSIWRCTRIICLCTTPSWTG